MAFRFTHLNEMLFIQHWFFYGVASNGGLGRLVGPSERASECGVSCIIGGAKTRIWDGTSAAEVIWQLSQHPFR